MHQKEMCGGMESPIGPNFITHSADFVQKYIGRPRYFDRRRVFHFNRKLVTLKSSRIIESIH